MLREFRRADAPRFFQLMAANFPEEGALLEYRAEAFEAVVRRLYRPDVRFLLRLLDALRHPVVRFFTLDVDGALAGTAILTFSEGAGFVSTVMVDDRYRRQGYAKKLMQACQDVARRAGRRYLVLDVLSDNHGARSLYDGLGFLALRRQSYFSLELAQAAAPSEVENPPGIRPMRRRDGPALVHLAISQSPALVQQVLPTRRRDFFVPAIVVRGLESETTAWVVDRGQGVEGFVRATDSSATQAGHVTVPLLAPSVPPELASALLECAIGWVARRDHRKVVASAARDNVNGVRTLEARGFREAIPMETLYRPIAG